MYIYFLAHKVKRKWMRTAYLGRRGRGGDCVLWRAQMYQQDTHLVEWSHIYHD